MKKSLAILLVTGVMLGGLTGTASAGGNWAISATWASGGYVQPVAPCRPVVVTPAPVVVPAPVVYTRPVVTSAPVFYQPPVVYPAPVVYSAPVVYTRPAITTIGFGYWGRSSHRSYCAPRYVPRTTHCSTSRYGGHYGGHRRR